MRVGGTGRLGPAVVGGALTVAAVVAVMAVSGNRQDDMSEGTFDRAADAGKNHSEPTAAPPFGGVASRPHDGARTYSALENARHSRELQAQLEGLDDKLAEMGADSAVIDLVARARGDVTRATEAARDGSGPRR